MKTAPPRILLILPLAGLLCALPAKAQDQSGDDYYEFEPEQETFELSTEDWLEQFESEGYGSYTDFDDIDTGGAGADADIDYSDQYSGDSELSEDLTAEFDAGGADDDDSEWLDDSSANEPDSASTAARADDGDVFSGGDYDYSKLEEVQVLGKASEGGGAKLRVEILDADVHLDALSSIEITRNGDSTAAAALARLPGLSLVDDKYVYVRGLGERYSSNTLNRGLVPSPDLTRDVLPLDIFPSSIIESVAVRKSYEVDRPASFGGGEIDIRTKSIPEEFFIEVGLDLGANSDLDSYKTYPSNTEFLGTLPDEDLILSRVITSAVTRLSGEIDPASISLATRQSYAEGQAINRELAGHVNRDFNISPYSPSLDGGFSVAGGDRYYLYDDESSIGFIGYLSYDRKRRHRNIEHRALRNPDENFSLVDESNEEINLVGYGSVGMEFGWNQSIALNYIFMRGSADKTYIEDIHHRTFSEDSMDRKFWLRFQSRELLSWQLQGSHGPEDIVQIKWHASLSRVSNRVPNELQLDASADLNADGSIASQSIGNRISNTQLTYGALDGESDNYAIWSILPFGYQNRHKLEFGFDLAVESRSLNQAVINFGSNTRAVPINGNDLLGAYTPDFINDPANGVLIDYRSNTAEPYSAEANTFGMFTMYRLSLGESWRLSAGVRWERYSHETRLLDPIFLFVRLGSETRFADGDFFPSLTARYSVDGNSWSDTFQFRFSYGRTVVRPDAREISSAVFIHPITNARVAGDPSVVPSEIDNYNISLSWKFDSGEFLSLTAFYKSISDPIENFEAATSDNDTSSQSAQVIANAQSASVYGIEIDGRYNLLREQLFISGNLTLLRSSLSTGELPFTPTNTSRRLTNASDYVANLTFGYEHPEGDHSLRLIYSFFGERLQYAGRRGTPDAFESPTQWLNLNYIYAFNPGFTVQVQLKNLLDENIEITQSDQLIYRSNVGREYAFSLSWRY